jgi:hypothetical protein
MELSGSQNLIFFGISLELRNPPIQRLATVSYVRLKTFWKQISVDLPSFNLRVENKGDGGKG